MKLFNDNKKTKKKHNALTDESANYSRTLVLNPNSRPVLKVVKLWNSTLFSPRGHFLRNPGKVVLIKPNNMEIAGEMVVKFYSLPIENLFITFFTDQSPCIQIQSVKFNVPLLYRQIYNKNILLGIKGRGGWGGSRKKTTSALIFFLLTLICFYSERAKSMKNSVFFYQINFNNRFY